MELGVTLLGVTLLGVTLKVDTVRVEASSTSALIRSQRFVFGKYLMAISTGVPFLTSSPHHLAREREPARSND